MGSRLTVLWLLVSSLVVIWDASFVLLRPKSMPGGDLHFLYKPYALYIEVDKLYSDMEDTFVRAQSWCNLVEAILELYTVMLILMGKKQSALFWGFLVSALTFWKTIIYMIQFTPVCNGYHKISEVDWFPLIFLFVIPNGIWIIFPFLVMFFNGAEILRTLTSYKDKKP